MDDHEDELNIQAHIDDDFGSAPTFGPANHEDEPNAQAHIDDEFGSAPTFGLANPLILTNHGDDDEGNSNGNNNGNDQNDDDSIHTSLDGENPSHLPDNDFFYTRNNTLFPKNDYTISELRKLAIKAGTIPLLQELFDDPEGRTMTTLLSGPTAQTSRGSMLIAAIINALHLLRSPTIIFFLKNIVDDLAQRPYTIRLEISNLFVGSLLAFIVEKPDELQAAITLIQESIRRLPTVDQHTRSSRSSRRSEILRFDDEEEEQVAEKDLYVARLLDAHNKSPLTELAERAQHMTNNRTVFMNVANSVEANPTKLDAAFNLVDYNSDEFLGNFGDKFVVATKLSVMNSGARKSLQEINSKSFPEARKDAFVESMTKNGMGQTHTNNALRDLESNVYSIGGSPLDDGGITAYGDLIGYATEYNSWNLAPHILTQSVSGSGSQALRSRRYNSSSSVSRSGEEPSRKVQLLTSLAILSTYSEKGPGGKLALTPTVEMQTLVKLMTAASLKMLQLFMDVIEECCDPKSKYYKMVTKSVHVDHSDLSIWIDSMNKIKFREFDTPEDLRDFDNSPACGIPSSVELDPNNVMAAIIDPQVFSWQSFKSAQLEKASSNTSVLATMENVIRLGFEIVHPDKRLTIWHFLHLLDHFLRQVRELPWKDVPFLLLRYGIALVQDNGKDVPSNLTENAIYISGIYNVSLNSSSFGNDVNEVFSATAFQTLVEGGVDAVIIRRIVEDIRRRPGALNGATRARSNEESSRNALRELSDAVMKIISSNAGTDRTSAENVSGSRMVTQLGAFGALSDKGHGGNRDDKSIGGGGGGKSGGVGTIDKEKASRGYNTVLNQLKKLDGTTETANSVCQNVNNSLRSCPDIAALFPTIPTIHVISPNQLNLKGSLSVEEYEKIKNLKPFSQGVRAAILDHCRIQIRKVSALGRECINDMKARNADLSKFTVASHMQDDGTISAKGRRVLSGLGKGNKFAGAAAKVDKEDGEEEPAKKGNHKKENKTKLDENDEEVKLYRSWQADQAERAAEEARAAAAADEDRKLKRLAKFQARETAEAFTKAFQQGGSPPDQDSDSDEEAKPPGRN